MSTSAMLADSSPSVRSQAPTVRSASSARSGGDACSSAWVTAASSWLTPRALIASISSRVRPFSSQSTSSAVCSSSGRPGGLPLLWAEEPVW